MKPTIIFSYPVFIVTFIITTQSIPSIITTATASNDVVYDVRGNKVSNNAPYYIGPVVWAKGGGIKLTDKKNNEKTCPLYVVQDPAEVNIGGKFIFTLSTSDPVQKEKYLVTSRVLGIHSGSTKSSCDESTFWRIYDAEAKAPSNFITTGGSYYTAATCFLLAHYPKPTMPKVHSYMLQHCPSYCGAGPHTCFNVSLYEDKGVRYLASSGTPFEFVFQKPK